MKIIIITGIGLALLTASSQAQLTLNFASNPGASVQFNGSADSFNFNAGSNGWQWNVTDEVGGSSSVGLNASVNNGPFSYGPITVSGSGGFQIQYATVLGPLGNLVLSDGSADLTGTVNWIDIATYGEGAGVLNAALDVNVSNIQYTGSNPDLQYLVANQPGSMDVSFQFATSETLTELSTGTGPFSTSYSGSLSVVPEPSTLALTGLGGLFLLRLRRRK
jgi:PEP-CTERM motif